MKRQAAIITFLAVLCAATFQVTPAPGQEKSSADYPQGLVHTVEQGDTLWDLSAKYLGTPWRWQELWERNRFLTNPHYIYPDIKVVIFPPPAKEMVLSRPAPAATDSASAPAVENKAAEAAPPQEKPRKAELSITPAEYVRAGEFLRERPSGIGSIKGGKDPKIAFSTGDKVYLSLSKSIPPGQALGVYRVRGPVSLPSDSSVSGYVKYLVGVLQVKEPEQGGVAATVRVSFEDLGREDLVTEEIPFYTPVVIDPGAEGLEASVIAGRRENKELHEGDFLYLDRGAKAGVAVGNVFRLFGGRDAIRSISGDQPVASENEVARVVVVKAFPEFATAYISDSLQSFAAGVKARRGTGGSR